VHLNLPARHARAVEIDRAPIFYLEDPADPHTFPTGQTDFREVVGTVALDQAPTQTVCPAGSRFAVLMVDFGLTLSSPVSSAHAEADGGSLP